MIRVAISQAAYDALVATLPLGSVAVEPYFNDRGERVVWLDEVWVDRLGAMRGTGESYSDVSIRLVESAQCAAVWHCAALVQFGVKNQKDGTQKQAWRRRCRYIAGQSIPPRPRRAVRRPLTMGR
jgi:hypothetical protein